MGLLSYDVDFYARAAAAWLLSATLAAAILTGWIRGQAFRARPFHLATLFYSTRFARDALKLHLLHGIAPESNRCRGPGGGGVLALGERVLMDKAFIHLLVWVAAVSFFAGLAVGVGVGAAAGAAILGKRTPPAPAPVPAFRPNLSSPGRRGLGGVGGIFVEVLLFVPCVLSCVHGLPVMILDYMAATTNCGRAPAA